MTGLGVLSFNEPVGEQFCEYYGRVLANAERYFIQFPHHLESVAVNVSFYFQ